MPDSLADENDSRTASVGLQRSRVNGSTGSSRHNSVDPKPSTKTRQGRNKKSAASDVRDFVPQGATFSATSLEVDPDSTSSSGSDSSNEESESEEESNASDAEKTTSQAPTINWNKASKTAIRTTLGGRISKPGESKPTSKFDAVNEKFWRSRSDSASTGDGEEKVSRERNDDDMEEGEVSESSSAGSSQMHLSGDSDDSEFLDSEADDSILLNVGHQNQNVGDDDGDDDDYDPESRPVPENLLGSETLHARNGIANGSSLQSKEDSLRIFTQKYPTPPTILADLDREDMELQAKYLFYDRDINDINLQSPIACIECLREGHLAEVCPSKECVHCGAWNQHQSIFCPSWRRCQRCRERGHDEQQCSSLLKGSASEVPCDLCGSSEHQELECDLMWKFPRPDQTPGPVLVSISCSHCTSNHHLVGDCPSLSRRMISSSFTLVGIDPNTITNINSVISSKGAGGAASRGQRGMKIRGRADQRSPSPDSDDMMSRPERRQPIGRNAPRPNIRFGSGIGKNKSFAPAGSRAPNQDTRQNYRDRQDYFGNNTRQRSLSPNPIPARGRGRDNWQPSPRSPPRGRSGPSRGARGGGNRGGRGGGRGGGPRRGGGDGYQPMPSAAKKNWDRYRF